MFHFSNTAHPVIVSEDVMTLGPLGMSRCGTWDGRDYAQRSGKTRASLTEPSCRPFLFSPSTTHVHVSCKAWVLWRHSLWSRRPTPECWWPVATLSAHSSTECHKLHSGDGTGVPLRRIWTQVSEDNLCSFDFFYEEISWSTSIKTSVKISVSVRPGTGCAHRGRGGDGEELGGAADNFPECSLWARPILDAWMHYS